MVLEKLILASSSPRRAEILRAVGWEFEEWPPEVDETLIAGESAVHAVERLALKKATAAEQRFSDGLVLAADTTVVVDEEILGKPLDSEDAKRMLRLLSGRWHDVITGVAISRLGSPARRLIGHERTAVRFGTLSDAEIGWYVQTGEPMEKAGAYAVQGRAALLIEEIRGDYWNVVGLPVRLVYELYREISSAALS